MNSVNYSTLSGIFALILGLLLVIWPGIAINYLVITVGVLFLVPGLIALVGYFSRVYRKEGSSGMFPVAGTGSVLFGLWLMIMPSFFVNILMYVLGFVLILGSIHQISSLVSARKWTTVPAGFYVMPMLIFIAGLVILVYPFKVASAAFIMLGVTSMVFGLSQLLNGVRFRHKP